MIKQYFYVLRPLLAINWLERRWGVVPTDLMVMGNQLLHMRKLKWEIEKLIKSKEEGEGLDYGPRIPVISRNVGFRFSTQPTIPKWALPTTQ